MSTPSGDNTFQPTTPSSSWFSGIFSRTPARSPVESSTSGTSQSRPSQHRSTRVPPVQNLQMNTTPSPVPDSRTAATVAMSMNSAGTQEVSSVPEGAGTTNNNNDMGTTTLVGRNPSAEITSYPKSTRMSTASPWRSQTMNGRITASGYDTSSRAVRSNHNRQVGLTVGPSSTEASSEITPTGTGRASVGNLQYSARRRRRRNNGQIFGSTPMRKSRERSGPLSQKKEEIKSALDRAAAMPEFLPQNPQSSRLFWVAPGQFRTDSGQFPNRLKTSSRKRLRPRSDSVDDEVENKSYENNQPTEYQHDSKRQKHVSFQEKEEATLKDRGVHQEFISTNNKGSPAVSTQPTRTTPLEPEPPLLMAAPPSGPFSFAAEEHIEDGIVGRLSEQPTDLTSFTMGPQLSESDNDIPCSSSLMKNQAPLEQEQQQNDTTAATVNGSPTQNDTVAVTGDGSPTENGPDYKRAKRSVKQDSGGSTIGWGNTFSNQFVGKWKCNMCFSFNDNELTKCASCEAPRNDENGSASETAGNSSVSSKSATTTTAAPKNGGSVSKIGFVSTALTAPATTTAAPKNGGSIGKGGFMFGAASTAQPTAAKPKPSSVSGFTFGTSTASSGVETSTGSTSILSGTQVPTTNQKPALAPFAFSGPQNESKTEEASKAPQTGKFSFGVKPPTSSPPSGFQFGSASAAPSSGVTFGSSSSSGIALSGATKSGADVPDKSDDDGRKKKRRSGPNDEGPASGINFGAAPPATETASKSFSFQPSGAPPDPSTSAKSETPGAMDKSDPTTTTGAAPPPFSFGKVTSAGPPLAAAVATPQSKPLPPFGNSGPVSGSAPASAPFGANDVAAPTSGSTFVFGKAPTPAEAKPTASETNALKQAPSFQFGAANQAATSTFGATNSAAPQPAATPAFGSSSAAPQPAAAPSFGGINSAATQPAAVPAFGSANSAAPQPAATPAFGSANSATPQPAATPTFGSANAAAPQPAAAPAFGSANAAAPQPAAAPAFGSANSGSSSGIVNKFNGASAANGTGFSFGAGSAPQAMPPAAPPASTFGGSNGGFPGFGAAAAQSAQSAPLNSGGFPGFGAAASQSAPSVGAPASSAFGATNSGFGSQNTQPTGGFGTATPASAAPIAANGSFQLGAAPPKAGRRIIRARRPRPR